MTAERAALLSVRDLTVTFPGPGGWFRQKRPVRAVNGVSMDLMPSEVLGLVGESGCGKTTLARTLVGLAEPDSGRILLDGVDLGRPSGSDSRTLRRRMQVVFQNPYSSMNPRMTVREILAEPLIVCRGIRRREAARQVDELLSGVGLNCEVAERYPGEMSGGQLQRVAIARALSLDPDVLIADEPVSSLDVSVQSHILRLFDDLRRRRDISILFISHDLTVVEKIADRIAVMHRGEILETGETRDVVRRPSHPYARRLFAAARATSL